ncbi:MAG: reverse transcriptase domain-containing protein [Candidatus Thiodiazotropha sp.]
MLEPNNNLHARGIAGARSLVCIKRGKAPIRLLNPTAKDVYLPRHKVVATTCEIDATNIHAIDSDQNVPTCANLKPYTTNSAKSHTNGANENFDFKISDKGLSETERSELLQFLKRNADVFSTSLQDLGRTDLYQHSIETDPTAPPVHLPFYRQAPHVREEIQKQVDDMLADGIIEPSSSIWNSPVVLVRKKNNTFRFAVDYRKLNKITLSISHPLPRLECVFDTIGQADAKIFSTLDLASGFWQIPMDPETRHKAAFITHNGVYEWTRMPFGLKNAPMTFQMVMGQVLRELNWKHVLCYIDDILVFSSNFQEHLIHLEQVFDSLRKAKLTLKSEKCHFAVEQVKYLGHIITKDGVEVDPDNTSKVRSFPRPKSQKEIRTFLGLCNYYRRFIENFSKIASPLNALLAKDRKFVWNEACETSFNKLKEALITAPVLKYPNMNEPFILSTDASGTAIGYILGQKDEQGREMVVAYGGRSLRPDERKYTVSEQECLAVVEGIKAYSMYLSKKFTVYTDHQALKWLHSIKDPQGRLGRWAIALQGKDFEVIHKIGRVHKNADALSRLPYEEQPTADTKGNDSVNVIQPQGNETSKEYVQVNFTYGTAPLVSELTQDWDDDQQNQKENPLQGKSVADLQRECPDFRHIFLYLENKTLPEDKKLAHTTVIEADQYALYNGVLYHHYQPRVKGLPTSQRLVRQIAVPGPCREDLLKSFHDSHAGGGHLGVQKTFAAIRERYYFPGMYQIISDYVTTCDLCQRMKVDRRKHQPPLTSMPIADVFSRWHMDILGPLPKARGYQYILLVVDSFSKWCEAFPLESQDAKIVASVLYNEIITRYGAPSVLVSDRGQNFMSKLVSALCEMFDITRHHTSSYHPQTNSTCERMNSTLAQTLRMYCNKDQSNWPDILPSVMMAFRMSPATEASTLSPFHMVFGKEMSLPVDTALIPKTTMAPDARTHFENLIERLKIAKEIAATNIQEARAKSKEYQDRKSEEPQFSLHDRVMLRVSKVPSGLSPKLFEKYDGPFYITELGPNYTYKLRRCSDHKPIKSLINASRIIQYKDPYIMRDVPVELDEDHAEETSNEGKVNTSNQNIQDTEKTDSKVTNAPTASQSTEAQETKQKGNFDTSNKSNDKYYEVDRLLKVKWVRGKKFYLVKWKGEYKNTWEPEDYITDKPKREFHIRKAGKKRRRRAGNQFFT